MKRIALILLLACGFMSCKKSGVSPGLFGKWELRREYGGIAGSDSTYAAGNGNAYLFNSDSTYTQYVKGKLTVQGTFHIQNYAPSSGNSYSVLFLDKSTNGTLMIISGTKMTLGTTAADGLADDYQKISD